MTAKHNKIERIITAYRSPGGLSPFELSAAFASSPPVICEDGATVGTVVGTAVGAMVNVEVAVVVALVVIVVVAVDVALVVREVVAVVVTVMVAVDVPVDDMDVVMDDVPLVVKLVVAVLVAVLVTDDVTVVVAVVVIGGHTDICCESSFIYTWLHVTPSQPHPPVMARRRNSITCDPGWRPATV